MSLKSNIGKQLQKIGLKEKAIKLELGIRNQFRSLNIHLRSIYVPKRVRILSKSGILAINLDSDWLGLGARIVATIELLMYAEEKGLQLNMRYGYRIPRDKYDYFSDLFKIEPAEFSKNISGSETKFTKIRSIHELNLEKDYDKLINLKQANQLFKKYFRINNDILSEVERFYEEHFKGFHVLGLHYRGTDKVGEAPKVDLEFVRELILKVISDTKAKYDKLFISSDEKQCIDFFKAAGLPLEIVSRNDVYRSKDGSQIHRNPAHDMSVVNREALVNCLLLSKSDLLVKTASILSDCCKIFNPDLEMIILNEPYSKNLIWWPATELNRKYLYKSSELAGHNIRN